MEGRMGGVDEIEHERRLPILHSGGSRRIDLAEGQGKTLIFIIRELDDQVVLLFSQSVKLGCLIRGSARLELLCDFDTGNVPGILALQCLLRTVERLAREQFQKGRCLRRTSWRCPCRPACP